LLVLVLVLLGCRATRFEDADEGERDLKLRG
jgi:hypothetical protein